MPVIGGARNEFQSIRSSCERCRSQKLKCALRNGSNQGPCQRCSRAKVECIFGRRRRASRSEHKQMAIDIDSNDSTLTDPATPTALGNFSCLPSASSGIEPSVESTMYGVLDWNMIQQQDTSDKTMDSTNDIDICDQQNHFDFEDAFHFDMNQLYFSHCPPKQSETQMAKVMMDGSEDNSGLVPRLLALHLKMQQRLQRLKEEPWRLGSICGLNDYPIGTILHLTQEFIIAVGPILGDSNEPFNNNMSRPSSNAEGSLTDDLARVLALSGYMSLMRIYKIAFGHFETHLSQVPIHSQFLTSTPISPALLLSELPCANAAHELGRTHTALRMLRNSLKDMEGQLGVGGTVVRDMVIAQLRKDTPSVEGVEERTSRTCT
jgi:hypothetical protein